MYICLYKQQSVERCILLLLVLQVLRITLSSLEASIGRFQTRHVNLLDQASSLLKFAESLRG